MTKDYVPKVREIRQIAEYRRVLQKLMDAALMGHKIWAYCNQKKSWRREKQATRYLASLRIGTDVVWRARNAGSPDYKIVDAAEARLMLRDYLHTKDGVSLKALDYAETIDAA